ncbi:hypothetical protein [Streptomyces africanus]|uniref:hypothetical protein n=1 Tax=Streptomyces africanus TaxID=231024 RepID=UPI001ABFBDD2|nr:hypothetical protein [Streptomyces africanus]
MDVTQRVAVVTGGGAGAPGLDASEQHWDRSIDVNLRARARPRPRDVPLSLRKPLIGAINGVAAGLAWWRPSCHRQRGGHRFAYASALARCCSPASTATVKSRLSNDVDGTYADSVARAEGLMLQAFRGSDVVEGVASHLDKRTPDFPSLPVRSSDVPV